MKKILLPVVSALGLLVTTAYAADLTHVVIENKLQLNTRPVQQYAITEIAYAGGVACEHSCPKRLGNTGVAQIVKIGDQIFSGLVVGQVQTMDGSKVLGAISIGVKDGKLIINESGSKCSLTGDPSKADDCKYSITQNGDKYSLTLERI